MRATRRAARRNCRGAVGDGDQDDDGRMKMTSNMFVVTVIYAVCGVMIAFFSVINGGKVSPFVILGALFVGASILRLFILERRKP